MAGQDLSARAARAATLPTRPTLRCLLVGPFLELGWPQTRDGARDSSTEILDVSKLVTRFVSGRRPERLRVHGVTGDDHVQPSCPMRPQAPFPFADQLR